MKDNSPEGTQITLESTLGLLKAEGLPHEVRTVTTVSVVDGEGQTLIHIMEFGPDGTPDAFVDGRRVTCHWQGPRLDDDNETSLHLDYGEPASLEELHFMIAAMLSAGGAG